MNKSHHEANAWIASQWMGKKVEQIAGSKDCIGRGGKVVETMWDERGALHCKMEAGNDWWWCPAVLLDGTNGLSRI